MRLRRVLVEATKSLASPLAQRLAGPRPRLSSEHWKLTRAADGTLRLRDIPLTHLVAQLGSPLMLFDAQAIARNAGDFGGIRGEKHAGIECFYSYKTNPVPGVLARIHELGVGAEVISEYELWLARRLGLAGDRIVLNGPGRTVATLRSGIELGALIHINHLEEIGVVAELARAVGKRARVGLRVVLAGGWTGQFGEPIAGGFALRAYREMQRHPELDIEALHVHRGGEIADVATIQQLVDSAFTFIAELKRDLGIVIRIADVGGSLGCPTAPHLEARAFHLNLRYGVQLPAPDLKSRLSIRDYMKTLDESVNAACARLDLVRPRVFVEPGRALTSNTAMLLCTVTALKASGAVGVEHAVLDAGINVAEPMRSEYHQIFCAGRPRSGERAYRLVGPICTPMDTLCWSWRGSTLAPGDCLALMDVGAYFIPFATSFSFPQPAIAMLDQQEATLLRRAESFEDMSHRDVTWGSANARD